MTTEPKLTPAEKKERRERLTRIVVALAGSTIINEVLDKADGLYTKQLVRIGLEISKEIERVTS